MPQASAFRAASKLTPTCCCACSLSCIAGCEQISLHLFRTLARKLLLRDGFAVFSAVLCVQVVWAILPYRSVGMLLLPAGCADMLVC